MIQNDKNFADNSILLLVIHPQVDPARRQVELCHENLFKKRISPCKQEVPDMKTIRQTLDHYLHGISNFTSFYGIFTFEILTSQAHQTSHRIQTDDIELDFFKIFIEYIKNIQL